MKKSKTEDIVLIGSGPMAAEYVKVLKALGRNFSVVGLGKDSANTFQNETGVPVITGGINKWLKETKSIPYTAIVAVGEKDLGTVTLTLLNAGVRKILVEKPGGFNLTEIEKVAKTAKLREAKVYVGYNRRFYASVQKAKEIIRKDGGVKSFNFEFTEWSHIISDLNKAPGVKEQWFLHNSTHVLDMAFFLGGWPEKLSAFQAGKLTWHPSGSIYAGSGVSENDALFSYQANWEAPGRWSVEVLTNKHRLIFRPLEKLFIQAIGSVTIEEVILEDRYDVEFKPGLYKQVEAFLSGSPKNLCIIEEQAAHVDIYKQIAGY